MGQHPTQVGTTALPGANLLPADLLVGCAFIRFSCTEHCKASTKRVTWAGEGANTEGIAEDEAPWLLAEGGRCAVVQGRVAERQELRKPTSACWQPANLSETLNMLPHLSLSTRIGCWGCRSFLPPVSPGRKMEKAVGQSQEALGVPMGKVH